MKVENEKNTNTTNDINDVKKEEQNSNFCCDAFAPTSGNKGRNRSSLNGTF